MTIYQDWDAVNIGTGNKTKQKAKEVNPNNTAKAREIRQIDEETGMMPKIVSTPPELISILQTARIAKNLKQKDLAKQLNIDVSIIANIEANKSPFNKNLYCKIVRALGVDTKEIKFPRT
jgi:ribosome-binding protein aMBF1 (putative translation factor)